MLKKFIIIAGLLITHLLHAQHFTYVVYEHYNNNNPSFILNYLLINIDNDAYFYNYNNDNFDQNNPDYELLLIETNPERFNLQPMKNDGMLKKNFQRKVTLENEKPKAVFAEEDIVRIPWKLENIFDEFMGMQVQKATAEFRGREWTVWFTPEIPISTGPWKLTGLPGLVLKAETELMTFKAVHINLKEALNKFPIALKQYFDERIPSSIPLKEALKKEEEFIKYLKRKSSAGREEGYFEEPLENPRESEWESEFEFD